MTLGQTGCTLTQADVDAFAALSGDFNPVHVDAGAASGDRFGGTVAHGMHLLALAWGACSMHGIGDFAAVRVRFPGPTRPGDPLTCYVDHPAVVHAEPDLDEPVTTRVTLAGSRPHKGLLDLAAGATGRGGRALWDGRVVVLAPEEGRDR